MSYRASINRARRADLPLAWRLSSFRSALLSCQGLLRQQENRPKEFFARALLPYYHAHFGLPNPPAGLGPLPADDRSLLAAIQDLERRRNQYLQRLEEYRRQRIREKSGGRRLGSRLAWPYGGFLPDEWWLPNYRP
jgi:hypothetical protein